MKEMKVWNVHVDLKPKEKDGFMPLVNDLLLRVVAADIAEAISKTQQYHANSKDYELVGLNQIIVEPVSVFV